MNQSKIFIGILFSFLLLGCTQAAQLPTQRETSPPQTTSQVPNAQTSKALTPEEADALIAAMIQAINKKDVDFFSPYLLERDRAPENVQAALNHYKAYFQGKEITNFERLNIEQLGKTGNQTPIQRFNYRIYNKSGLSKDIAVYQDQTIRFVEPFLLYSLYANRSVERYMSAIQSQDVEQLSQIVNLEEEFFSKEELKAVLAQYKDSFSLENLNYELTGLNPEYQHFIYTLSEKDGDKHEIKVLYGDGLVSINDSFLPIKN
ncbi:MAG: hypothetical protein AB1589_26140 [Cyanobacteriota bacterium]